MESKAVMIAKTLARLSRLQRQADALCGAIWLYEGFTTTRRKAQLYSKAYDRYRRRTRAMQDYIKTCTE